MTVSDIAGEIHINRNSVAKYLDILLISGHAEMVTFGPAKVFFPSSRVPLSDLLNFTHDYIILLNRELQFVQVSESLLRFFEIKRSEIIGRSVDAFPLSFFQIPEIAQNVKRALEGTELTIEKQYALPDRLLHLRIRHIPVTFDDGEPGVTLIIEDVTDRKKTEEKMKQTIREWETTFNAITDMMFIQDNEFSILRANRSFADFLHMKPEDCIGKKCYHLIHKTNTAHASCPCTQVHHTKKPAIVEFYEPHLERYLEISASPILTNDGEITGSVHIMKDITERKKNDE